MSHPSRRTVLKAGALAGLAAPLAGGLAGCALGPGATAPAADGAVLAPNPNLLVQGIPPIPMSLVQRVQRYTDFRGHRFVDWHPRLRQMLVAFRPAGQSVPQLHLLTGPLAPLQALTASAEPVTQALFEPLEGRYLVFERSRGGNEAAQIYRLDLQTRQETLLTHPDERHDMVGWLHDGSRLIVSSVPLDRTAQGGTRAQVETTYWLTDPMQPGSRREIARLPGGGWFGGEVSPDDRRLAVTRYLSAEESEVWLVELADGRRQRLLPAPDASVKASHYPGAFTPDGRALWFASNRGGEFLETLRLDLASGAVQRITGHIPWDTTQSSATEDGSLLAVSVNVDGRAELRLFDGRSGQERPRPAVPAGSVVQLAFHRRRADLALTQVNAQGPGQIQVLDTQTGRVDVWTRPEAAPGIDPSRFREQQVVRWTSFDGRTISGLLNLPPPRFTGPRPVLIDIHGGPEGQATVGFMGRYNYLTEEMGLAIVQPNVRGSSGFGKTFLSLDNGRRREDSVKDIGALLDWIATQPGLDASRVMVAGGSYGGYMSLAVSVHHADRIAGAIDDVGISHFVTFLESTESYRRDLRRVEYGDERDPAMRAFLDSISPLTQAHRIRKPLFVVQGRNDPRVPYTEAEQIVAKVRANGTPVWYLRAENEGHGFARKENADFRFYAMVRFIETVLLKQA